MIHIAVCDDDKSFLDYIQNKIIKILEGKRETAKVHKYISGIELLKFYDKEDKPFHIVFLDIDMPKINGLEVAEVIRSKDKETILIFLTSMEDVVYKAFKYNIFRFIRKSYMDIELEEALTSAMKKLRDKKRNAYNGN